jgi:AcrR family transcriptional regulator
MRRPFQVLTQKKSERSFFYKLVVLQFHVKRFSFRKWPFFCSMTIELIPAKALTFADFKKDFEFNEDYLYALLFERNQDLIGVRRERFAVRNMKKIFRATFKLVPKIGFKAMSLRDLLAETGLSMGGIYLTITNKDNIAIIVKDAVTLVCEDVVEKARAESDPGVALERLIKGYLYASLILQPWFHFLYFETRSLPLAHQDDSKNLERSQVAELQKLISQLQVRPDQTYPADFLATMVLTMVQERYLKPWKYKQPVTTIDEYAENCLRMIQSLIHP